MDLLSLARLNPDWLLDVVRRDRAQFISGRLVVAPGRGIEILKNPEAAYDALIADLEYYVAKLERGNRGLKFSKELSEAARVGVETGRDFRETAGELG